MNILVAFGGVSPEHEVSVITAMQVISALKESGHHTIPLYITKLGKWLTGISLTDISTYKDIDTLQKKSKPCYLHTNEAGLPSLFIQQNSFLKKDTPLSIDVVLPAFHGSEGENGAFQGLCEIYNLPYTGSLHTASAIGMDKDIAKRLCKEAGIAVTDSITFLESEWIKSKHEIIKKAEKIEYPLFVKPSSLGSSIGVAKADSRDELITHIETAFRYDIKIVVEKGISPLSEINCSVLGDFTTLETSVCEMPKGRSDLLSFDDKYLSDNNNASKGMASADRIIPAPISDEKRIEIETLAQNVFRTLGCSGLARLDFLMHSDTGKIYFNEINTIPGSFSFYLWDKSGYSFPELLDKLISIALEIQRNKSGRVRSYETNLLNQKSSQGIKGLKGIKK